MNDSGGDSVDEFITSFIRKNLSDLTESEKFAVANADLHMLRQLLAEGYDDPKEAFLELCRRYVAPELPHLIGEVVIASSIAEDAAGTFLQTTSGGWKSSVRGFGATSNTLLKKLKPFISKELWERFSLATDLRHFVVHGLFIDGSFKVDPKTGEPYRYLAVKRTHDTDAPDRKYLFLTEGRFTWLRDEFHEIAGEIQDAHNNVLIERSQNEDEE